MRLTRCSPTCTMARAIVLLLDFDIAAGGVPSRKKSSALESRFASLWDALGGSELVREFRFDKTRRWRADFASNSARVLIEVEGGVWRGGRHTNPQGFINDAEKYLAATLQGWSVIRLVGEQLNPATLRQVVDYVRERDRLFGGSVA